MTERAESVGVADGEWLLTLDEAVRLLRTSRTTIWKMSKRGDLPVVRMGRRTLFRRADVIAYIERHVVGGEQAAS